MASAKITGSVVVVGNASMESRYSGEVEIEGEFETESIRDLVILNFNPEDVFDKEDLEDWAEENGFVKEGENDE